MPEKLTLENLQNWVNEVSPVFIDLSNREVYLISKIDPGIAGRVRTLLDTENEYACLSTYDIFHKKEIGRIVKIRFGYTNYSTKHTVEYKEFIPQDL